MNYRNPYRHYGIIALILFIVTYSISIFYIQSFLYPLWVANWSGVTLLLFGYDKLQSQSGSPRIPEKILYLLIILGGFLGAILGMSLFKHKKRKAAFWIMTGLSVLFHGYILFTTFPNLISFFSDLNKLN